MPLPYPSSKLTHNAPPLSSLNAGFDRHAAAAPSPRLVAQVEEAHVAVFAAAVMHEGIDRQKWEWGQVQHTEVTNLSQQLP